MSIDNLPIPNVLADLVPEKAIRKLVKHSRRPKKLVEKFEYDKDKGQYKDLSNAFIFAAIDNPVLKKRGRKKKIEFTREMINMQKKYMLSELELNFCRAYSKYNNLGKAVMEAGYNCSSMKSAKNLGLRLVRRPGIMQYIATMQSNLRDEFETEAKNAFKLLIRFLNEEEDVRVTPRLRVEIAKDILDRAGYKAKDSIDISANVTSTVELESKALKEIAERARGLITKANTEVQDEVQLKESFVDGVFEEETNKNEEVQISV